MSQIETKYHEGYCRVESGIFLSNDQTYRIYFAPKRGYYADNEEPLSALVAENGEQWWFETEARNKIKVGDLNAIVGGGPYEGEGFVALTKRGKLQWIIHFESSEVFTEVEIANDFVIARANDYPHKNTLTVRIESPKEFTFSERITL